MKVKNLLITTMLVLSTVFVGATMVSEETYAAFNAATQCPAGSLYKTNPSQAKENPANIADCNLARDDKDLMKTATTIINVIVGVVGILAVAVIVLGGVFYVTSAGDSAKTKKAQNTIIYGIVGLIISLLAFAIVNFVLKNVFS